MYSPHSINILGIRSLRSVFIGVNSSLYVHVIRYVVFLIFSLMVVIAQQDKYLNELFYELWKGFMYFSFQRKFYKNDFIKWLHLIYSKYVHNIILALFSWFSMINKGFMKRQILMVSWVAMWKFLLIIILKLGICGIISPKELE